MVSNPPTQIDTLTTAPTAVDPLELSLRRHLEIVQGKIEDTPWRHNPVPFHEFVTSREHMQFPALGPRQLEIAYALLNYDPKKTFEATEKLYDVACCLLGKGSGKDTVAALIVCYVVYILLCLKKPYQFLTGYDVVDEAIDIVNVAYSFDQASNVFFTKLRNRVKNWRWLRKNFRVRESGKDLDPAQNKKEFLEDSSTEVVTIYPSSIMFPNMIRAFSRHSLTESTEGLNLICWCLDEASAMKDRSEKANADKLYDMLKTSAQSRFPGKWFGFVLSFPRYENDFTMRMYKDTLEGKLPRVFGIKGATWEINPTKTYEDFKEELENPKTRRDALAKYACEPPTQELAFIEYPDKISECVNRSRKQIVEFNSVVKQLPTGARLQGKGVLVYNIPRQPDATKYVARIDLGHKHDRCSLAVGHLESGRVIIDLVTCWQPAPDLPVDVDDPGTIIIKLKRELVNIQYVTIDQWQSLSLINRLNRLGIVTDKLSLHYEEYKLLRDAIYSKQVEFPDYPLLTNTSTGELARLQLLDGNRVDHPADGFNDLSEAVVGVVAMLLGTKKNVAEVASTEDHYTENEGAASDSIWASEGQSNEDVFAGSSLSDGLGGVSAHLR